MFTSFIISDFNIPLLNEMSKFPIKHNITLYGQYMVKQIFCYLRYLNNTLCRTFPKHFLNKIGCRFMRDGNNERHDNIMHANLMLYVGLFIKFIYPFAGKMN